MKAGAQFAESDSGKPYPQITYTSVNENAQGEHEFYITPEQDGDTYTFTVPDDIDPQYPSIRVLASFTDIIYSVNVPGDWDEKIGKVSADKTMVRAGETVTLTATVARNVSFDPETDLIVSYIDGNGATQQAAVTLNGSVDYNTLIEYTYTFTMPAYDVNVSAAFGQKAYHISQRSSIFLYTKRAAFGSENVLRRAVQTEAVLFHGDQTVALHFAELLR